MLIVADLYAEVQLKMLGHARRAHAASVATTELYRYLAARRHIPTSPLQIPASSLQIPESPLQIPASPLQIPASTRQIHASSLQIPARQRRSKAQAV